jgi:hypothetical protein
MANYVAHYRKKLQTLARNRLALKRLLRGKSTEEQIAIAAEAVRNCQIRALEAKKAQIPPSEESAYRIHAIEVEIETCKRQSLSEIVAACLH